MRRVFMVLLITLTALRGFVGDAMAVQMMSGMERVNVSVSPSAEPTSLSMPCHSAADDEAPAQNLQCTTCQVCHLSACLPQFTSQLTPRVPSAEPSLLSLTFMSADLRSVAKPPIS